MAIYFFIFTQMGELNMDVLSTIWSIASWFQIVVFLLSSWWLYMINKKLWEEYPWLAWIPVINIYSYVKASWKSLWWILWIIIWFMLFVIPWLVMVIMLLHWISKRTWRWAWTTLWFIFVPFIMFPVVWSKLEDKSWEKEENQTGPNTEIIVEKKVENKEKIEL